MQILPEDQDGFLINSVTLTNAKKRTIYTRYGDWFPIICFVISLGLIGILLYRYSTVAGKDLVDDSADNS